MTRKWIIAGTVAAALAGLGTLAYAASDRDDGHRGPPHMRGETMRDFGWSGQRWRDEDRDERRYRDGDRYERRYRDEDRRGEGRRFRDDDDGYRGHRGHGGRHGMGPGYGREGRGGHMHGHRHGGWHGRQGAADPAVLDGLKRELSIGTAQEEAWSRYAAAMKETAVERSKRRESIRAGAARNLSVEEHRKFRDLLIEQRQKEIAAVRDAADALVATLDEKQVAVAREVLPGYAIGPVGRGMGRMGMGPQHRHWER